MPDAVVKLMAFIVEGTAGLQQVEGTHFDLLGGAPSQDKLAQGLMRERISVIEVLNEERKRVTGKALEEIPQVVSHARVVCVEEIAPVLKHLSSDGAQLAKIELQIAVAILLEDDFEPLLF